MAVLKLGFRHKTKKRKTVTAVLLVFLALGIGGGVYAYRVISAIVDLENNAVVALPPRDPDFAFNTPTPAENDSSTEQLSDPTTTPAPGTEVAINITDPSLTPTSISGSVLEPTLATNLTPTIDPYAPLPTSDDPSGMSVIQDIIDASVGSGDPGLSEVWGGKTDINILLLGVDVRAEGGDQNADVIIIAHVDLISKRVAAVSIPRDLYVEIPGVGQDKINSAYNYGYRSDPTNKVAGIALMRYTIESVFQVPIDGYIMVDFEGFTEVVDEMGGVTIDVPSLLIDEEYPTLDYGTEVVTFLPGVQEMNGDRALKYVRTRHQDSDDGRRERQLAVLRALFDQAKSFGSITNGYDVITALGGSVQTSFGTEQQLTLARIGNGMADADIELEALGEPLITGGTIASGAWVYQGDPLALQQWVAQNLSTDGPAVAEIDSSSTPASSPTGTTPTSTPTVSVPFATTPQSATSP